MNFKRGRSFISGKDPELSGLQKVTKAQFFHHNTRLVKGKRKTPLWDYEMRMVNGKRKRKNLNE